jgi:exonuclease SbcC
LTLLVQTQAQAEAEIAELRGLQGALAAAATRIRTLEDESEALEFIRESLRRAGPHITETLIRQISDGARQIFSDLMADHSRHLAWEKDYSITLEVDGRKRVFSQLSGGEQMSAALSVRLALLREMSSIDVAFFDEPTANLDEVRREALARQILQVRGFQQLFVISHDDTFEQATQNMIRVERHAGKSVVSVG